MIPPTCINPIAHISMERLHRALCLRARCNVYHHTLVISSALLYSRLPCTIIAKNSSFEKSDRRKTSSGFMPSCFDISFVVFPSSIKRLTMAFIGSSRWVPRARLCGCVCYLEYAFIILLYNSSNELASDGLG